MNWLKNIFKRKNNKSITNKKKGWLKIEYFHDGCFSGTNYYDHNGNMYTILDLIIAPGFSGATLTNIKE